MPTPHHLTLPMVRIEGAEFLMGSARFYPEERPVRYEAVESFLIDVHPVTNEQFAHFVEETGYLTRAERGVHTQRPGSFVFIPTDAKSNAMDPTLWWPFTEGASWRHPLGPESQIKDLMKHPVTHIAHEDAQAYARWLGKRLPTEAEWECAARGGLMGLDYAWGNMLEPGNGPMANYWQGEFPHTNTLADGWLRTSPVCAFPSNGFGLYDMIGNVWEWTDDLWHTHGQDPNPSNHSCCAQTSHKEQVFVIKGGSHLCAKNYCQRYRPAARHPQEANKTTGHIGFRCAKDVEA